MRPLDPQILKPPAIDSEFVCRQMLEIADRARESGKLRVALQALAMIAEIRGMADHTAHDE